jgi:D-alanyl-D-alanine endopeptidase (penicillin-binding protein 7)
MKAKSLRHKKRVVITNNPARVSAGKKAVAGKVKARAGKHRVALADATPAKPTVGDSIGLKHNDPLALQSNVAFVVDQASSKVLFEKIRMYHCRLHPLPN